MSPLERLRRRICGVWWRLRHGRVQDSFSIPRDGLHPDHLAVVLPPEFHDFDVARHLLDPLLARLNPRRTTVLVRDSFRTWLSSDLDARIIAFDPNLRSWLGFPRENLLRKTRDLSADVVVDLTPSYHPFTAALAVSARAPLRISLDDEFRSDFYNCLIQTGPDASLTERYDALLRFV